MSEKNEALRQADWLDVAACGGSNWNAKMNAAAAKLRRLQADNEAFGIHLSERMVDLAKVEAQRDALLEACKAYDQWADKTLCYDRELRPIRAQIRAAIKAVEEGK